MEKIKAKKIKVAILGATSHIAKGLIFIFCKNDTHELYLFARSPQKVSNFLLSNNLNKAYHINALSKFGKEKYDVIINCVGIGDPNLLKEQGTSIFELTETYDNMVLDHLRRNKNTIYINFSSGAVYGKEFLFAANANSANHIYVNKIDQTCYYSIAKLNSEAKHRSYRNLRIIDLRVFAYFSRFIDLKAKYLMAEIINAIKERKVFLTGKNDIVRDYIGSEDLFSLVCCCIKKRMNGAYDVYSRKPVRKFEILESFQKRFGLDYKISKATKFFSSTGSKNIYCSKNKKVRKLGYVPKYNSLELLIKETEELLAKGEVGDGRE